MHTADPHNGSYFREAEDVPALSGTLRTLEAFWHRYRSGLRTDAALAQIAETDVLCRWFSMLLCVLLFGRSCGNDLRAVTPPAEGLRVYRFRAEDPDTAAGCCSARFFVIPPQALSAAGREPEAWRDFYLGLQQPGQLVRFLKQPMPASYRYRLLLPLGEIDEETPLRILRDILESYLDTADLTPLPDFVPDRADALPLAGMQTDPAETAVLTDALYLLRDRRTLSALYPFPRETAEELRSGRCRASVLLRQITLRRDGPREIVTGAVIEAALQRPMTLTGRNGQTWTFRHTETVTRAYTEQQLYFLLNVPTLCLYPDLSQQAEHRCRRFTYLSAQDARITGSTEAGRIDRSVDLSGDPGCFGDLFSGCAVPEDSRILMSRSEETPRPLIGVFAPGGRYLGCLVSLRADETHLCPAMLRQNVPAEIAVRPPSEEPVPDMMLYADIGETCLRTHCRIGDGGALRPVGTEPFVRPLLWSPAMPAYTVLAEKKAADGVHPALLLSRTEEIGEPCTLQTAWLPMRPDTADGGLCRIPVTPENRRALCAALYQICSRAACLAASVGCSCIQVVPSVPVLRQEQVRIFRQLLDRACTEAAAPYRGLHITPMLTAQNAALLTQPLSAAAGRLTVQSRTLTVCADIGSSLKLCAVRTDRKGRYTAEGLAAVRGVGRLLSRERGRTPVRLLLTLRIIADFTGCVLAACGEMPNAVSVRLTGGAVPYMAELAAAYPGLERALRTWCGGALCAGTEADPDGLAVTKGLARTEFRTFADGSLLPVAAGQEIGCGAVTPERLGDAYVRPSDAERCGADALRRELHSRLDGIRSMLPKALQGTAIPRREDNAAAEEALRQAAACDIYPGMLTGTACLFAADRLLNEEAGERERPAAKE